MIHSGRPLRPSLKAAVLLLSALLTVAAGAAFAQGPYHVETRWTVGGEGGWDYMQADPGAHRLYLAHGTRVDVVDTGSGKVLGAVTGLMGVHGVVIRPDGKVGFVSDGRANAVVAFDTRSFAVLASIPAGTNPDGLLYEAAQGQVWAFNGRSMNATVLDPTTYKVLATIPLPGKPEFPAADGRGGVWVNIEDKNEMVHLRAGELTAVKTFALAGCDGPSGLAIDPGAAAASVRLFSVCGNGRMAVTDGETGRQLGLPAIGKGPDAAGYDPARKLAFSSNGQDGTLTVIDAGKPDYPVLQTLPTERSARTMAFDSATGRIYLASAKLAAPDASAPPRTRPTALPGTFGVVVVSR